MKESFADKSCRDFGAMLASSAPVPGGGGAAALMGALGAALCAMAGNLTLGKKKYENVAGEVEKIITASEELRLRLMQLIDEDASAFETLWRAYSIKADRPEREQILTDTSLAACRAPMEMLDCCCRTAELLERMLAIGNSALISDVGCGAAACAGAMESSAMNVLVNTRLCRGNTEAESLNEDVKQRLKTYMPRVQTLISSTMEYLEK